jgi:hypothetical protein
MAYDRYSIEWHLTPNGWVKGTETYFGKAEREVLPPSVRVETWLIEVEQSSGYSPEDVDWKPIWTSADSTPEEISTLRSSFPPPPKFPK